MRILWMIGLMSFMLGLVQATFWTFMPSPFHFIEIILPLTVYIVAAQKTISPYVIAIMGGIAIEWFSPGATLWTIPRYLLLIWLLQLLFRRFFTNQSIYSSFVMMAIARLGDQILIFVLVYAFSKGIQQTNELEILPFVQQSGADLMVILCLMVFHLRFYRKTLRPLFFRHIYVP